MLTGKNFFHTAKLVFAAGLLLPGLSVSAQIDVMHRNLLEFGIDQPLKGKGPEGVYLYYYYNRPDLIGTNIALRLAVAPLYMNSELGFKNLISPTTSAGLGVFGGAFGNNYYEVRQGDYIQSESFYGHGGGLSLNLYQLLDPGVMIPLNLVVRGGFHYITYDGMEETPDAFRLPEDQIDPFTRMGLRLAGKQPVLFPDFGMEVSVWFEKQWRLHNANYGFNNDRTISPSVNLYWGYAEMHYAWTNSGQKVSVSFMTGTSSHADRFSAWRPGGDLPLVAEFPLILPGYYYQELTVERFVHLHASYQMPLDDSHCFELRLEAAALRAKYLPGFEQPDPWQTGAGIGLVFTPKSRRFTIAVHFGYGFNAVRHGHEGSESAGLLFQYNFGAGGKKHRKEF